MIDDDMEHESMYQHLYASRIRLISFWIRRPGNFSSRAEQFLYAVQLTALVRHKPTHTQAEIFTMYTYIYIFKKDQFIDACTRDTFLSILGPSNFRAIP